MQGPALLRLPDELLSKIIEATHSEDRQFWRSQQEHGFHRTCASLCLACRRLYPIAMPLLYSELVITCSPARQLSTSSKLLHRSCRQNPALWPLCRRLEIDHFDDSRGNDSGRPLDYIASDLISWLTGTTSLALMGLGQVETGWELLYRAAESFPNLNALVLEDGDHRIHPWRVMQILGEGSEIRRLALDGVSKRGPWDAAKSLPMPGTALIKSLELRFFLATPGELEDLMRWPAALENFELEWTFSNGEPGHDEHLEWSLAILQPLLAIQSETLRCIRIAHISPPGLGLDLRAFEQLEHLCLMSQDLCVYPRGYDSDKGTLVRLLAPRPRLFTIEVNWDGHQEGTPVGAFRALEEDWLRAFGHVAVKHKSSLHEIRIKFEPYEDYTTDSVYPWDRMDALRQEFRPRIKVTYSPPSISREEYAKCYEKCTKIN
ncbi:hypothetical protein BDV18DRAFT_164378 [Aspergillus unguis]